MTPLPCEEKRPIVLLVQFPDVPPPVERSAVEARFNTQLNRYMTEMSYGTICLDAEVTEAWYTLPHPVAEYSISSRNLEVNKTRVRNLIQDAVNAADRDVDFSAYSFVVLYLSANVSEYGMVGLCGYPGMLGWTDTSVLTTGSGEVIPGGVAIYTYHAHLGTLFHDIAHVLGGVQDGQRQVPCLYDHDLQAQPGSLEESRVAAIINLGYWDPMSCHYYKADLPPPGITSWTRLRLGWMAPEQVRTVDPRTTTEVLLGPVNDPSAEILAIRIPLTRDTYYLLENRQPLGFDRNLPGQGVLLLYADDTIPECRQGQAPVKLVDAHPEIPNLEGAAFEVGGEFTDSEHQLRIQVTEKIGTSYRIRIAPL